MKLLFDFFPILLFFICYKLFGIYYATAVAMIASVFQVVFFRIKHQHFEKMHVISLVLILVLGGATLFLHDPWFIKWKPTGVYWLTAIVLLGSRLFSSKTLTQKMMENNINLPLPIWHRLNYAWVSFFIFMGILNLYVATHYSTDTWVNFKLFGGVGITFTFVLLQALYLSRHMIHDAPTKNATVNSQG